jgi:hypothetical protein
MGPAVNLAEMRTILLSFAGQRRQPGNVVAPADDGRSLSELWYKNCRFSDRLIMTGHSHGSAGRTIGWRGVGRRLPAAGAILFYFPHLSETAEKLFPGFKRIIEWRGWFIPMTKSRPRSKENGRAFGLKAKYHYVMIG